MMCRSPACSRYRTALQAASRNFPACSPTHAPSKLPALSRCTKPDRQVLSSIWSSLPCTLVCIRSANSPRNSCDSYGSDVKSSPTRSATTGSGRCGRCTVAARAAGAPTPGTAAAAAMICTSSLREIVPMQAGLPVRVVGKKIDVRTLDELRRFHAESCQQVVGLAHTGLGWLVFVEYDLELQEMPQPRDLIEMNARSSEQKQRAVLRDTAHLPIRQAQGPSHSLRRRGRRAQVEGLLRSLLIATAIVDELAVILGERANLQPSGGARKISVVLWDFERPLVCNESDLRHERFDTGDSGLDLDVSGHAGLTLGKRCISGGRFYSAPGRRGLRWPSRT